MKIAKYIGILLVVVVGLDQLTGLVMERVYRGVYTGQSGGKINYLVDQVPEVSVLALGNSRCAHHVIPGEVSEKGYNLSHNGMSMIFHIGLVDQLVNNESVKIDTVLLHLERHALFSKTDDFKRDIQHLKYYHNKNDWIREEINDLSNFEFVKFWFSSYKFNGKALNLINNRIKSGAQDIPARGYEPKPPTDRDSINVMWSYEGSVNVEKKDTVDSVLQINAEAKRFIQHAKELCAQKGITLVCFTSPVYNPVELPEKGKMLDELFRELDVPYLNYWTAFHNQPGLQSIHLWNDADHLNHDGAAVFSQLVRQDLKRLKTR